MDHDLHHPPDQAYRHTLRGRDYVIRPTGWGWAWTVFAQDGESAVVSGEASNHAEAIAQVTLWSIRLQASPELETASARRAFALHRLLSAVRSLFRRPD